MRHKEYRKCVICFNKLIPAVPMTMFTRSRVLVLGEFIAHKESNRKTCCRVCSVEYQKNRKKTLDRLQAERLEI